MNILVADNNENLAELIKYELATFQHQITVAPDGQKALNLINKFSYDLIITDILLPFFSGLELINTIHKKYKKGRPKIIILTQIHNENTVARAFELGIDDYLTKPFDLNFLALQVKKLVEK